MYIYIYIYIGVASDVQRKPELCAVDPSQLQQTVSSFLLEVAVDLPNQRFGIFRDTSALGKHIFGVRVRFT